MFGDDADTAVVLFKMIVVCAAEDALALKGTRFSSVVQITISHIIDQSTSLSARQYAVRDRLQGGAAVGGGKKLDHLVREWSRIGRNMGRKLNRYKQ